MVRSFAALCCAAAFVAGCGSDSDSDSSAPASTATAPASAAPAAAASEFIACFKQPGYEATRPVGNEASLFALLVKKHGYSAVPVNVGKPGGLSPDAFLVFFSSPDEAAKAVREVAVVGEGDLPPLVKGALGAA